MKFISVLGHPLFMASYVSIILLFKAPELFSIASGSEIYLFLAVFLTTCLIPALSIFSLRLFSNISNLEITERKERPLPFLMIFVWYGIAAYIFTVRLQLGPPFSTIFVTVASLIGLLLIITRWFKISIHAAAIWGAAGILSALVFLRGIMIYEILIAFFVLAGLTSTSRLYLGLHAPKETWTGTIVGFFYCFIAVYLFG